MERKVRRERGPGRSAAFVLVAAIWLADWGWMVHGRTTPLWIDSRVSSALTVGKHLQDQGLRLLIIEGPVGAAVAAAALALIALGLRSVRGAAAVLIGVAMEVASVQWAIKPIIGRHELAPDFAFPSTHVGAVVAVVATAVLLLDRHGPLGGALPRHAGHLLRALVVGFGLIDVLVVCAAAIATGGHLFSDVVAVIPWGVAVPWLTFALLAPAVRVSATSRRSGEPRAQLINRGSSSVGAVSDDRDP